jgi:hypothetical protein
VFTRGTKPRRKAEFEWSDLGMPQLFIPPEIAVARTICSYGLGSSVHPTQTADIVAANFTVFGHFAMDLRLNLMANEERRDVLIHGGTLPAGVSSLGPAATAAPNYKSLSMHFGKRFVGSGTKKLGCIVRNAVSRRSGSDQSATE